MKIARLFLALSFFLLYNISLFAEFDTITKFPLQDSTLTHGSSAIISGVDGQLLFFWSEGSTIFMAKGNGNSWYGKQTIIKNIGHSISSKILSVIKTHTERIILVYTHKVENVSYSIKTIYSDDYGEAWSLPSTIATDSSRIYLNQSLTETKDDKIWLIYNKDRTLFAKYSINNGLNWSDETRINYNSFGGSLIADNNGKYYVFYTMSYPSRDTSNIHYKISSDLGKTWVNPRRIFINNYQDFDPCAFVDLDGSIKVLYTRKLNNLDLYNYNRVRPIDNLNYELHSITSYDNGVTWSDPIKFTEYAGCDYLPNLTTVRNARFVTFLSTRFIDENTGDLNKTQIWYGVLGESEDKFTPPVIKMKSTKPAIPRADTSITFAAQAYDNEPFAVKLIYSLNGTEQEPVFMNDNGMNGDLVANDSIYSYRIDKVDIFDRVEYSAKALDIRLNSTVTQKSSIDFLYPYGRKDYLIDINNIRIPINNYGIIADVPYYDSLLGYFNPGAQFDSISFLYSGGFALSGLNNGEIWSNGVMSASRVEDYVKGAVENSLDSNLFKIYVVASKDLPFSASWIAWQKAVELGANFYDGNGDGIYNPVDLNTNGQWDSNEDRPDLIGDVTAWCVLNDAKPSDQRRYQNIEPQGIEIKQTVFAYSLNTFPELANVIYIRYNIENKGTVAELFDSVYFSAWTDPDLGDYEDDVIGSDTTVNSGYCYNNQPDGEYGNNPPAFFVTLLQGPVSYIPNKTFLDNNSNNIFDEFIDTPLDTAYSNYGPVLGQNYLMGGNNLEATSITHYLKSDPTHGDASNEFEIRNYTKGLTRNGQIINPCNWPFGEVLNEDCSTINPLFLYSGDPVTQNGWLCNTRTDQRLMVNSGPFKLEKGKPQEIIIAYVVGRGIDYFNSVTVTRQITKNVIGFYESNFTEIPVGVKEVKTNIVPTYFVLEQNYPNPFNPTTTIKYSIPSKVKSDTLPTGRQESNGFSPSGVEGFVVQLTVYDVLGREITTLVNQKQIPGSYEINFDASKYASGVYYYQLKVGKFITTKKMILLK